MSEISRKNFEGEAIIFLSIYNQSMKYWSRYDLIEIEQTNKKGKDEDAGEKYFRCEHFRPRTIFVAGVSFPGVFAL